MQLLSDAVVIPSPRELEQSLEPQITSSNDFPEELGAGATFGMEGVQRSSLLNSKPLSKAT